MARKDDDAWRRRRERELEDEQESEAAGKAARRGSPTPARDAPLGGDSNEKLLELLARVEPLIEQVNSLYQMYFSGAERRPPLERRALLDQTMQQIQALPRPTPALQFKAASALSSYSTFKEKWERALKARESGPSRRG